MKSLALTAMLAAGVAGCNTNWPPPLEESRRTVNACSEVIFELMDFRKVGFHVPKGSYVHNAPRNGQMAEYESNDLEKAFSLLYDVVVTAGDEELRKIHGEPSQVDVPRMYGVMASGAGDLRLFTTRAATLAQRDGWTPRAHVADALTTCDLAYTSTHR